MTFCLSAIVYCVQEAILRIAFPDLEKIARDYLELLGELKKGNNAVEADYEWVLLTMLDQMVRNVSGGRWRPIL